ncbi:MAG: phosphoglycerate kinase [Candidatus Taylorbacteria bacterium]|nr:phosphoglycerate kinase [Candidatus Taylorbacteria bacterium]
MNKKKVLLRCDFDVPVVDGLPTGQAGKVVERFRIQKQKPVIDFLLKQSAVVMVAHIKAIKSFKEIIPEMESILGHKFSLIDNLGELGSVTRDLEPGTLYLLDNIRNWPGEEKNDESFAKMLSTGFDLYINNCFSTSHRKHASFSAITKFLPSYSGFLVEEETNQLSRMINLPKEGKIFIMGGAKASTKVPVIKNFIDKAENILVGGVVANDILRAMGVDTGLSVADEDFSTLLAGLDIRDKRLVMPLDFNIHETKIYDIGPKTIREYINIIESAKIVIWNGPVGLFEDERFSAGTDAIAWAIAGSGAFKTIGGGDTITAVNKLGLLDKFDFVSTGGGAMLEFLAGNKLPGLEALGYYKN